MKIYTKQVLMDSIIESGLAMFLPAISNAVPWLGDVLIISNPIVILTVFCEATDLSKQKN